MSQFSPDRRNPLPRFRPGPGQIGAQAVGHATKKAGAPAKPSGGASPRPRSKSPDQGLGLPPGPQAEQAPPDYRHLLVLAQHRNIQGLGRSMPVGIHMLLNGTFRQNAQPGQVPFDWLMDI
jgi:hypothetical protein